MPGDLKQRFAEGWGLAAEGYDTLNAHFVTLGTRLAERAALFPGDQVLDVACGTGAVTLAAARRVEPEGHVTGIDLAPGMVARARANALGAGVANVTFAVMDAEALEFADESFGAALSGLGLFFLPDMPRGLAEIARVLKPGGRLAFTCFGKGFLEPLNSLLARDIRTHGLPPNPLVKQMSWEPDVLHGMLESAGFFMVRAAEEEGEVVFPAPEAWWGMLWYGAFRTWAYDAEPERMERFRAAHLAAVAGLAAPDGLHVRIPVITVQGVRA